MIIAIEGIDGCGKGTQSKMLVAALNDNRMPEPAVLFAFPRYQTFFGEKIRNYLAGQYGAATELHPMLVSTLYALNRFEAAPLLREMELRRGESVVVCDRYVGSNIGFQAAKFYDLAQQEAFIADVEYTEHTLLGALRPELTIVLDVPIEVSRRRLLSRNTERGESRRDMHEENLSFQTAVRHVYLRMAETRTDWVCVNNMDGDRERSPQEIHAEVLQRVRAVQ